MSDFDYSKENKKYTESDENPVDKYEKDYSTENRAETNKNIKLLNDILTVSNTNSNNRSKRDSIEKKKKKEQRYDNMVDLGFNMIKEPIYLILLYILMHTKQVNNLLIRYLPEMFTHPDNFLVYYGVKGVIFSALFLVIRYKL